MLYFSGISAIYRRVILLALQSLKDCQTRSNIDSIRRRTHSIFIEDDCYVPWSDILFFKCFKDMIHHKEIDVCANVLAELSPHYKRQRVDNFLHKMESTTASTTTALNPSGNSSSSLALVVWNNGPVMNNDNNNNTTTNERSVPFDAQLHHSPTTKKISVESNHQTPHNKEPIHRHTEHDKWKIMPKKIYDQTM